LLYQPLAVVYHNVPAWRTNFDYFTNRCYAEGLSKSQVTHYVGSGDGLASERSYVLKTLPMGVLNGIGQSIVEGNLIGLNRSAAIIVGLFFTTLGYLAGIFPLVKSNVQKKLLAMNLTALRQRINIFARNLSFLNSQGNEKGRGIMGNQNNNHQVNHESIMLAKVLDIELSQALPNIDSNGKRGEQDYQRALVLARLHSYPIGMVYLDFIDGQISSGQLASLLWDKFRDAINQHLLADGLEERINLPEEGLTSDKQMNCLAARQESLADAPLISIVIASRDRSQSLSATLNSLLLLDYPNFEIILVDNAPSSDETYELFLQGQAIFARENISLRYVREDTPGLAVAHNRGLELATGVYVAFTDDDVVVDKNWLTEMLRGFKAAESVGCVTGLAVPIELDTPAQVLFEEYGGFIKGFKQNIYDLNKYRPSHPLFPYSPGHFGTGANMGFRTEFLKKSGGFDPALGIGTPTMGADDLSAFFQMIIAGHQLVYQPSALVFHQHRRSYEALRKQMFGYGTGLTVFLMKCAMDHPRLIFDIVPKIPIGLKLAFSTNSAKNQSKSRHYPRELEQLERKGMLYGPLAYLKSRWRYRKIQHNFKPIKISPDSAKVEHYWVRSLAEDYQENKKVKEV
jgi:GT2 family glycosyltransferase